MKPIFKRTILVIALLFSIAFTGCGNHAQTSAAASDFFIMDYNDRFQYNNGELYVGTGQLLHFVDFSSVTDVVICPKPIAGILTKAAPHSAWIITPSL